MFHLWSKNPLTEDLRMTINSIQSEKKAEEIEKPIETKYSQLKVIIPEDPEDASAKTPPLVFRSKDSDSKKHSKRKKRKHHKHRVIHQFHDYHKYGVKGGKDPKFRRGSENLNWRRNGF
jgi:hypothetical protein